MSASAVRMGRAFVEIGADATKLFKGLQEANARMGRFAAGMRSMGSRMAAIGTAIAAPMALAARQFMSFDDAIRATAAVSGATGADLQALNDRARHLGETTSFTAVQVANLMTELGRAGFKPDEINAMTGAVLDLARATGTDATLASGIMAATLRQFSLGAGDAARVADVLTTAANATFNTVEGLGESLKFAGPVAKSLGMSLEDTVAVLGVLGNVGIQGSEAGTALRRLSVIAAGSGAELQKIFGVSNTDAAGQMKPLVQILDEINTVTANMPVAERTAKMAQAFGLLGITSANVLSQSAGGVAELADKLRNAEGSAARTAKEMDAGLGGSTRIALSAIEGLSISVGEALAPALQSMLGTITSVVGGLTTFVKQNQELIVAIAKGIAIFTAAGAAMYGLGAALGVVSFALAPVLSVVTLAAGATGSLLLATLPAGRAIMSMGAAALSAVPAITAAITALASYAMSLATAGAASLAAGARFAAAFGAALAADITRLIPGVIAFTTAVATSTASYVASLGAMVVSTVTSTATMAASWLASAVRPITIWATTTAVAIAGYVTSLATAVMATVTSTATMAAGWLVSLMPATTAFVVSAVSGLGAYVLSVLAALSATLASTVAMAAAWLAPLAPIALIGVAIVGAGALLVAFGGQIAQAFLGIGGWISGVAESIGGGLSSAISTVASLFDGMGEIATTAFSGIYAAIVEGDLAGAMDILWLGLQAGWLRGVANFMTVFEPWIDFVQNVFTYMAAGILTTWDGLSNGIAAIWDNTQAIVQKGWNWLKSLLKGEDWMNAENAQIDAEVQRRADERGRNTVDHFANADQMAADRLSQSSAGDYRAAADAAQAKLGQKVAAGDQAKTYGKMAAELLADIEKATTIDQLGYLYDKFDAMSSAGRLSDAQSTAIEEALADAQVRIQRASSPAGTGAGITAGAGAAGVGTSQAEVAGSFSAAAIGGMGVGSSLQQQMADYAKRTADATERIAEDGALTANP